MVFIVKCLLMPDGVAQPVLEIRQLAGGVELSWPAAAGAFVPETVPALATGAVWQPVAEAVVTVGDSRVLTLPATPATQFFRLRQSSLEPLAVVWTSPAAGEAGVAVTRETVFRLSEPLAANTLITGDHLFAEAAGRRLLARSELGSDRQTLSLFYLENLPGGTRVEVVLDGTGWTGAAGEPVDFDGDGLPGGAVVLQFETANTAPLANTAITGRILASEPGAGGADVPLPGVTITVDGQEETLRTITDAQGNFRLQPCPAGRFFVNVDGRTSPLSQWPNGAYYPTIGKGWEATAGKTNNLAGGTGTIYLPLVAAGTLQPVSATEETKVTFPPAVIQQNPFLAGVEITVPPNSLFADNGTRGGSVGLAPVASDRLPEPLPAGLNHAIDISIQTSGPQNFDRLVAAKFPNLPDPVTGEKLPPGAKTALWSFNHDTGRWEIQGAMTVTPDGNFVETDPGVGIRQPGWHGVSPGSSGGGGPGGPPPCSPPGILCEGCVSCEPGQCPPDSKQRLNQCQTTGNACTMKCWEDCGEPGRPEGFWDVIFKTKDCAEAARCSNQCLEDGKKCKDRYLPCVLGGGGLLRALHGRRALIDDLDNHPALVFARELEQEMRIHNALWLELEAVLNKAPTYEQLSVADKARAQELHAELRTRYADKSPAAYYAEKERQFVELVLDSPFAEGTYPAAAGYYVLEDLTSGLIRRGRTEPRGYLTGLILRPDNAYRLSLLLGPDLKYHETYFTSASAGQRTYMPYGQPRVLSATDADGDGIPVEAEFVLGTSDVKADTDGDGVKDLEELRNNTNPLDGQPTATGVIASLDTPGTAVDVVVTDNNLALVADNESGLAVIDVSDPLRPALAVQINLGGGATSVAVEGTRAAVGTGSAGVSLLDLANDALPQAFATVPLPGITRAVTLDGGIVFAGSSSGVISAVDAFSASVLTSLALPGNPSVSDIGVRGPWLYVWAVGVLHVIERTESGLVWRRSIDAQARFAGIEPVRRRIFVGTERLYAVNLEGTTVFDLTNPGEPVLVRRHDTTQTAWKHMVPALASFALATDGLNFNNPEPHDISVYDLGEDGTALNFIASFPTPGLSHALILGRGFAFLADGKAGLQVVNFLAPDTAGVPPTLTLKADFPLDPPRIESGQIGRLTALARDDVMVRQVDFYVDGELAKSDRVWPFDLDFVAPPLGAGKTTVALRVSAEDTAGNATAADLVVELLPDQTPPKAILLVPVDGAVMESVTVVQARFNEPLDFQSVTPQRVRLFSAGADLVFGNGDDQQIAGTPGYSAVALAAQLELEQPLPPGRYRFESDGLRDLAGNVQAVAAAGEFWVAPGGPAGDPDGDGLTNEQESAAGTSPFAEDTDGDGWADEVEVHDGSDPRNANSRPRQFFVSRPPVTGLIEDVREVLPAGPGPVVARPPAILILAPVVESAPAGPFVARPTVGTLIASAAEEAPAGPYVGRPPAIVILAPNSEAAPAGPHVARPPVSVKRN